MCRFVLFCSRAAWAMGGFGHGVGESGPGEAGVAKNPADFRENPAETRVNPAVFDENPAGMAKNPAVPEQNPAILLFFPTNTPNPGTTSSKEILPIYPSHCPDPFLYTYLRQA